MEVATTNKSMDKAILLAFESIESLKAISRYGKFKVMIITKLCSSCCARVMNIGEQYEIKSHSEVDLIVVVNGSLKIKYSYSNDKLMQFEEDLLGNGYIDINYWKTAKKNIHKITANSESEILFVPFITYDSIINDSCCFDQTTANFIIDCIPFLESKSTNEKADVISLFKKIHFAKKDALVREGEGSSYCYLIFDGSVLLKNKTNDHLNYGLYRNLKQHKIIPRGLLSETTLSCIFGTFSSKHWVGDETMYADSLFIYTAETLGKVIALQLKRTQISAIPMQCLEALVQSAKSKLNWLKERILLNNKVNTNVLNNEEENKIYQVALNNLKVRYPIANEDTLHKLRDQRFAKVKLNKRALININLDAFEHSPSSQVKYRNINNRVSFSDNEFSVKCPQRIHFLRRISDLSSKPLYGSNDSMAELGQASALKNMDHLFVKRKKSLIQNKLLKNRRYLSFIE